MNPFFNAGNVEAKEKALIKLKAYLSQFSEGTGKKSVEKYVEEMRNLPDLEHKNMAVLAAAISQYDFILGEQTQQMEENIQAKLNQELLEKGVTFIKYEQKEKKEKKVRLKAGKNYDVAISSNIFTYIMMLINFYQTYQG